MPSQHFMNSRDSVLSPSLVPSPFSQGERKGPARFVHEFAMNIISDVQTLVETLNVTRFV